LYISKAQYSEDSHRVLFVIADLEGSWLNSGPGTKLTITLPESIISDQGAQFAVGLMKELNRMLGIETKLSTAFHPQTDGQTERANQELEQYLRMFVDYRQEQWPDWLGTAEFAYNNKVNSSTKVSPFMANNGRNPRIGFEMRKKGKVLRAEEFVAKMKEI